jgi:hypothetical protein
MTLANFTKPFIRLAVATLLAAGACGDDDDDGGAAEASGIEGVQTFEIGTPKHVETDVDYPQTPPAGGDHAGAWINCGAYPEPVPEEMAVHSMEHGAVWITYQPDLAAASVAKLAEIGDAQTYVLVSPYPDLPSPVVASAWGVQLQLDSADDDRLVAFLDMYRQGDQTPEPGAPCTGGITPP